MRAILMFHNCEEQSHKTVSTDHNFWRQRRAKVDSNRGPSAYQPNAVPLGQTGSQKHSIGYFIFIEQQRERGMESGWGGGVGGTDGGRAKERKSEERRQASEGRRHTPSIAFRHLPPILWQWLDCRKPVLGVWDGGGREGERDGGLGGWVEIERGRVQASINLGNSRLSASSQGQNEILTRRTKK